MAIKCAYCEEYLNDFNGYKFHLKVFHNKQTYGDELLCGQAGRVRDFNRFITLEAHMKKSIPVCRYLITNVR